MNAPSPVSAPLAATEVSTASIAAKLTPDEVALLESRLAAAAKAKAGRSGAAAENNRKRSRAYRDKVAKAVALVSLHDLPDHARVDAVRKVFLRYGSEHFGLTDTPDDKTIRETIKDILEGK